MPVTHAGAAQGELALHAHLNCSLWRSPPSSSCRSLRCLALPVPCEAAAGPGALCSGVTSCDAAWLRPGSGGVTSAMRRFSPVEGPGCLDAA